MCSCCKAPRRRSLLKFYFKLSIPNNRLCQNIKNRIPWKSGISHHSYTLTSCLSFTLLYYIHIYFKAVWTESKEIPDAVCCSPKRTTDYIIITDCKSELKVIHHKSLFRVLFCGLKFLNMILYFLISAYIFFCFPQLVSSANIHTAQIAGRIFFLTLTFVALLAESIFLFRFPILAWRSVQGCLHSH